MGKTGQSNEELRIEGLTNRKKSESGILDS